jgi:hypothetical protein
MLFSGNGSLAALVALSFSFGISGYRPEQLQEHIMTKITIKDLADSVELDREAMSAITGGARTRGRQSSFDPAIFRSTRIVDYPPGVARTVPAKKTTPAR